MRSMIENMEQTKEELVKRFTATNQEKMSETQDKAVLLQDIQNYKQQLLVKESDIVELRKNIEALDANIDEL